MRFDRALLPLLALVGFSFAQETNFSVGPQYLVTTDSPMLLRPIATPSLSLGETQPVAVSPGTNETTAEQTAPSSASPSDSFLSDVYWGEHQSTEIMGRRLETPSMAPSDTAWYMNSVASQSVSALTTVSAEATEVSSGSSVIQLSGAQLPSNLPSSILDVGVTGTSNAQSLLARGYGLPLGDVAAYWKSHKRSTPRVFTNSDVHPRK
ncbi:MAG TPA: hypothetical protein VNX87_18870 [Candidatus Sulfotelmatobacter sp.]|jgi:hypothetical protein|nr:hypothetical protein [Candidatus Sulfotelmatobacter sp.]